MLFRSLQEVQRRAAALGCTGVVHALMHESAPSLAMSRRLPGSGHGYVLLGRRLRELGPVVSAAGADQR